MKTDWKIQPVFLLLSNSQKNEWSGKPEKSTKAIFQIEAVTKKCVLSYIKVRTCPQE